MPAGGLRAVARQRPPAPRSTPQSCSSRFGKSLIDLMLDWQLLSPTVMSTAILTGIPEHSVHHRSTSIGNSRSLYNGQLSRSIAVNRVLTCDFPGASGRAASGDRIKRMPRTRLTGSSGISLKPYWRKRARACSSESPPLPSPMTAAGSGRALVMIPDSLRTGRPSQDQNAGHDQRASSHKARRERLAEEHQRQDDGEDDAELVDRRNQRGRCHLQRAVIE